MTSLHAIDWMLILGYFAVVFGMGLFRLAVDTPVKLMSGFVYVEGYFTG